MPVERLLSINDEIKDILNNNLNLKYFPKIIVVCKTFSMDKILPLINLKIFNKINILVILLYKIN